MTLLNLPAARAGGRIVVQAEPVPKARPRLGRGRIFTPRTTELAEWQIRETWVREIGEEVLVGSVSLEIVAYLPQQKAVAKRDRLTALPSRRPDADNLAKTVLDALNGVAFADDAQVTDLTVRKRYAVDAPPRWKITVREGGR